MIDAESTGQVCASSTAVATNLFAAFGVPMLAGRGFVAADAYPGATAVVVDRTFADNSRRALTSWVAASAT